MDNWNEKYYFPKELNEEPEALKRCLAELEAPIRELAKRCAGVKRIHIVGSGDCYFVGFAAAYAFEKLCGVWAQGFEAYDYFLNRPEVDGDTAVFLFSSSGKSLYVQRSLEYVKSCGGIAIGVTNHDDSPLAVGCDELLLTSSIGVAKSFPTKTTTCSIAVLFLCAVELGAANGRLGQDRAKELRGELMTVLPGVLRRILSEERPVAEEAAQRFLESRGFTYVGSGPARTCCITGAAKIVETSRGHVTFCNAEEFLHLHCLSVKSSDAVVIIGNNLSDHREVQVANVAHKQRARVLLVGAVGYEGESENIVRLAPYIGELSEYGAVVASLTALQLFACELSHLADNDPDEPRGIDFSSVVDIIYTGPVSGWRY